MKNEEENGLSQHISKYILIILDQMKHIQFLVGRLVSFKDLGFFYKQTFKQVICTRPPWGENVRNNNTETLILSKAYLFIFLFFMKL